MGLLVRHLRVPFLEARAVMILALDLSPRSTGVCFAPADKMPDPFIKEFRDKGEGNDIAASNCGKWIRDICARHSDGDLLVCVEGYVAGSRPDMIFDRDGQLALHFATLAVCSCYGVRFESVATATLRKHFIGVPFIKPAENERATGRELAKAAVLKRAKQLGYLGADVHNDNLGDAAMVFDYAVSTFARRSASFRLT